MLRVFPGVPLVWATFLRKRELIRVDFPTLERPEKTTSINPGSRGSWEGRKQVWVSSTFQCRGAS
jgi:hypothetical protein